MPKELQLRRKIATTFAKLAFALNGLNAQAVGQFDAKIDDVFGHFWIFDDERSVRSSCQCGLVAKFPGMSWTLISIFDQNFIPWKNGSKTRQKLNLENFGEKNITLDLATPKLNAILAAVENAETLSSVGTVIHIL